MPTATVGMIPAGGSRVNPYCKRGSEYGRLILNASWRKLYCYKIQPPAYHGRPEKVAQLTQGLNSMINKKDSIDIR